MLISIIIIIIIVILLIPVNTLIIIIIINIPSGVFALVYGCYTSMSLANPAYFMPWLAISHLPLWSMWSFVRKLLWRRAQEIGEDYTKVHFPAWHGEKQRSWPPTSLVVNMSGLYRIRWWTYKHEHSPSCCAWTHLIGNIVFIRVRALIAVCCARECRHRLTQVLAAVPTGWIQLAADQSGAINIIHSGL